MTLPSRTAALLDTNVASFAFGNKPEVALYEGDLKDRLLLLSFQTVAEMLAGAELKGWGKKRRAELEAFLDLYEWIYPDEEILRTWVRLRGLLKKSGKALSSPDSWIAATALAEGHTLIAHDGAFRHVPDLDLICRVP